MAGNEVAILVTAQNRAKALFAELRQQTKAFAEQVNASFRTMGAAATQEAGKVQAAEARVAGSLKAAGRQASETGDEMVRQARRGATATQTHFDSVGKSVGAVVLRLKDLAVTAGLALGAAAGAAGFFGIKTAAANETAMISFELLLGGAEKARAFLGKLQAFSAATPFEMPTLKDAASRLLAVGINADRIIPLMTRLGNATAGMGTGAEGIGRAVYALQQMQQAGKVSLEDINQLTDAGIPALDALSSRLGITVAKLREEISAGKIKPEELFKAIETGAGATFKRLDGMMERQSASLSGIWSTFKDNASQSLATFVEPAVPALKRFVSFSAEIVPRMLDGLKGIGKAFGDAFKGTDVAEKLVASFQKMGREVLPYVRDGFNDMKKAISDNREGLIKLGHFIANNVVPAISFLVKVGIVGMVGGFRLLMTILGHVVDIFNFWRATAFTTVKFVVDLFRNMFGMMVNGAAAAFGWIPGIGPKLKKAADDFNSFFRKVDDELDRLAGKKVDVYVNASYTGAAARTFQSRNVIRAMATGGIGGGYTMLAERGRELLELPHGTMVRSNPDTENMLMRAMAAGGGGSTRLTVEPMVGSGDRLMRELVRLLRFIIRNESGGSAEAFFARSG